MQRRASLSILLSQRIPRRVWRITTLFLYRDFSSATHLLFALQAVFDEVAEDGAKLRIGCSEEGVTNRAFFNTTPDVTLDVQPRVSRRKQLEVIKVSGLCAKRRVIVNDIDAAPEGAHHQIILTALNFNISDRDRRQVVAHLAPTLTAVLRNEYALLSAQEQKIWVDMVFGDGMGEAILGKVARYRLPTLSLVRRLEHIGLVVAAFVIFHDRINDVYVVHRGLHIIDVSHVRHSSEPRYLRPSFAPVFRNIDHTIVGAHVNQTLLKFALADHDGSTIHRGRVILGNGIHTPDTPHHLKLISIDLPSQIGTDFSPAVATIIRAEEILRCVIQAFRVVRTHQ